jgi:hypothetical protein
MGRVTPSDASACSFLWRARMEKEAEQASLRVTKSDLQGLRWVESTPPSSTSTLVDARLHRAERLHQLQRCVARLPSCAMPLNTGALAVGLRIFFGSPDAKRLNG